MNVYSGPSTLSGKPRSEPCNGNPEHPHLTAHRWREAGENRYGDMVWKCADCGTVDVD